MTGNALRISSNTEERWRDHRCREKAIIITYPERVFVALIFQHPMRKRLLSSVVYPAAQFFFPYFLINRMIFEKKK